MLQIILITVVIVASVISTLILNSRLNILVRISQLKGKINSQYISMLVDFHNSKFGFGKYVKIIVPYVFHIIIVACGTVTSTLFILGTISLSLGYQKFNLLTVPIIDQIITYVVVVTVPNIWLYNECKKNINENMHLLLHGD